MGKPVRRVKARSAATTGPFHLLSILLARFIFTLSVISVPSFTGASDVSLEKDLQSSLEDNRAVVRKAKEKIKKGAPADDEVTHLKTKAKDIKASHQSLLEKFRHRGEEVSALGGKATERHRAMEEGYKKAMEEYLSLIDNLPPPGQITQQDIENLEDHLDKHVYKKKKPLLGALPYRNLNYPAKEPSADPPIKPAYKGGNKIVSPDDTKSTEEAPLSREIATLAQSLNWKPIPIYEYVKNNIETEWYRGCRKGAEETLRRKSGNDCDQATLFAALLRASGFPTRYVRGTIEFFAGGRDGIPMNKAKNLLGTDDPWNMAEFFQRAGIPFKPVISGGTISNFQIEHIWIESFIPYGNYRGTMIDDSNPIWLGLDTSIKPRGYAYSNPVDIFQQAAISSQLSVIRDEYLSKLKLETPLEYLQTYINSELGTLNPPLTYNDLLKKGTIIPENMKILPASMQFTLIKATHEYTEIPDELKHKVRFTAADTNSNELFSITLNTLNLSNRKTALSYEPETVEDQQIINAYGGLDNTPAYLVRLRPVLKVEGERVAVATNGLPMGADYSLTIELISPNGTEKVTGTHITGNLTAIGIVSQRAMSHELSAIGEEDDAETILFKEANSYAERWNQAEEELASLLHIRISRPIPTVVSLGGVIDVTYLLDMPHGLEWKGVSLDANLKAVETAISNQLSAISQVDREKTFMQLSALQGSALEHKVFEDDFLVDAISTAKLLGIAGSTQPATEILTINRTNVDTILPTLPFDDEIKEDIVNSVNQNSSIRIPQSENVYKDWTGIGYIKENPATGEAGYMLSGMIAGGMTAVSPDSWSNQALRIKLGRPYGSGPKAIAITSPKSGAVVYGPFVMVTGTLLDPKGGVTVNGVAAIIEGNTFGAYLPLNPGSNTITAATRNSFGVRITDQVVVTKKAPVALIITFPFDGAEVSATPVFVEGIVSDPGASVEVNGVKAAVFADGKFIAQGISLSEGPNQITASAVNQDGVSASQSITVSYRATQTTPITLAISSPLPNTVINGSSVMVKGIVTSSASEVWIKVNGIVAEVYKGSFVINNLPLIDGANLISVAALDSNGSFARAEITVTAIPSSPHISLNANITSGIPPLTAYFSASTEIPNPIVSYQMDFDGDGVIDYTGTTFEDISHSYTTTGIYYPTVTVTDDQWNAYKGTVAIAVLNKAEIDRLLKGKWEGMKEALKNKDIRNATSYYAAETKQVYNDIFVALSSNLPQLIQEMQDIQLIRIKNNTAIYRIRQDELYGGQIITMTYHIYFVVDSNGVWKIYRY